MTKTINEAIRLDYTKEEKEMAKLMANSIIHFLSKAPIKMKWLVISTLYESFPKEELKQAATRD